MSDSVEIGQRGMMRFLPAERWRILFLTVLIQAITYGATIYAFTLFARPWMGEFGLSRSEVVSTITFYLFVIGFVAMLCGRMFDLYPAKYLVAIGLALLVAGLIAISFAPSHIAITAVYVLIFPISGNLAGPLGAMALVARNFDKHRGLAMGIATLGTSLGGVVVPLLVSRILPEIGWRQTFQVLAVAAAILIPLTLLVLWGERRHIGRAASDASAAATGWKHYLSQPNFWIIVSSLFLGWLTFTSLNNNLGPYGEDIGLSTQQIGEILSAFALSMVVGKFATGALSDYVDNRFLFVGASLLVAAAAGMLYAMPFYGGVLAAFLVMGLGTGSYLPLNGALYARCFGPQAVGRVMGLGSPFITFIAIGPVLAGFVRDATDSYAWVFIGCIVVTLLSIPIILQLKIPPEEQAGG